MLTLKMNIIIHNKLEISFQVYPKHYYHINWLIHKQLEQEHIQVGFNKIVQMNYQYSFETTSI